MVIYNVSLSFHVCSLLLTYVYFKIPALLSIFANAIYSKILLSAQSSFFALNQIIYKLSTMDITLVISWWCSNQPLLKIHI